MVGKDDFAATREVQNAFSLIAKADSAAVRYDIAADEEAAAAAIANSLSPSLFGEPNVLVIHGLDEATEEVSAALEKLVSAQPDDVWLIGTHPGGVKGKRLLDILRKAGAIEVKADPPKAEELIAELKSVFKKHKKTVDTEALEFLHLAIGSSLGALHAAASQLCNDIESTHITIEQIREFYNGVGEVDVWALGAAMWEAKPLEVLHKFRWALELDSGSSVVSVISLANSLRSFIKFASAPAGLRDGELAALAGVPPWKLRDLRKYKSLWSPEQLEQAVILLAQADRASKGTKYVPGLPGGHSLDKLQSNYLIEQDFLAIRPGRA